MVFIRSFFFLRHIFYNRLITNRMYSQEEIDSLGGPTGYAINPVRDLGPRIMYALLSVKKKGSADWSYSWIPVFGSLVSAVIYLLFVEKSRSIKKMICKSMVWKGYNFAAPNPRDGNMASKKTVRITVDIPVELHAYLKMLAAEEGLTLQEFVLKCLPNPECMDYHTDLTDQMCQAEEIMKRNRKVLKKLSK